MVMVSVVMAVTTIVVAIVIPSAGSVGHCGRRQGQQARQCYCDNQNTTFHFAFSFSEPNTQD
jgi:hypothetical protein